MSFLDELKRRNVLRVAIAYLAGSWLLIQVLETLFPIFKLDAASIQIVVIVLGIGFVPVLILAWAFELTSEGLKRDADVDRDATAVPGSDKIFDRVIMVVLAMSLGYFAYDKFVLDPARDAEVIESATEKARTEALFESLGDKSIVVLPFVNTSTDIEQEYFADGLSEELLNLLSRIQELRVISRTSAFSFKGKDIDIPTVAAKLNVDHVLEGSVRKSGNTIRITAQLIDARTDSHLWSEVYDRTLDDIFVIQDEIAAEVVSQLKITLLGEVPTAKRTDPEAYALYMRARHIVNQSNRDSPLVAKPLLEQALDLDPEFVPALGLLGRVYLHLPDQDLMSEDDARNRVRALVARMLAIDPHSPEPYAWLGWIAWHWDNDTVSAARHLERALELAPANVELLRGMTGVIRSLGRLDEAIAISEYVVDHDPLCVQCFYHLGRTYRSAGRIEEAEAALRTAIAFSPEGETWRYALGNTLLLKGDAQAALAEFEAMDNEGPPKSAGVLMALHGLGRQKEFDESFQTLKEEAGDKEPWAVGLVYAWMGVADQAFAWLEKEISLRPDDPGWVDDPLLRNLHGDPRWQPMLARFGRSAEQLAAIPLKITLPPGVTLEKK